jgi:hypothetical protein
MRVLQQQEAADDRGAERGRAPRIDQDRPGIGDA